MWIGMTNTECVGAGGNDGDDSKECRKGPEKNARIKMGFDDNNEHWTYLESDTA